MNEKFNKDETFLARWLSGELSAEELKEFEAHDDFAAYKKIAETSAELQTPTWKGKEDSWKSFKEKTATLSKEPTAKVRKLNPRWMIAVAAIAILLVGYFTFFQDSTQVFSTPVASQQTFTLPDGSEVILNALSYIEFDQKKFLTDRKLALDGEAFFKVKKGSKFLVETQNGSVQVMGTSFNVFSRKNKLDVACHTGLVGVFFDDPSKIELLTPTNRIIAKNGKITSNIVMDKSEKTPRWSTGESRFTAAELVEVIAELERQFGVKISYPKELEKIYNYNGGFPHNDLDTALKIIFPTYGYQYKINGKEVNVFK